MRRGSISPNPRSRIGRSPMVRGVSAAAREGLMRVVTGTIDSLYYQLNWADPQGASTSDYDLFALDPTGTRVVASSTNVQNGTSDPHEEIDDYYYDIRDGSRIVIVKKPTAATLAIWLNMDAAVLSTETNGAVWGHSAAAGAFSCRSWHGMCNVDRYGDFTLRKITLAGVAFVCYTCMVFGQIS